MMLQFSWKGVEFTHIEWVLVMVWGLLLLYYLHLTNYKRC